MLASFLLCADTSCMHYVIFYSSQMGFNSVFFARLDFIEKYVRYYTSELEMIWQNSLSLGRSTDIFTGILYPHYNSPIGFCFDKLCSDPPIMVIYKCIHTYCLHW